MAGRLPRVRGSQGGQGAFCSLTASVAGRDGRDITDLDDVSTTIGSVSRLRELAAAFSKRLARATETLLPTQRRRTMRRARHSRPWSSRQASTPSATASAGSRPRSRRSRPGACPPSIGA